MAKSFIRYNCGCGLNTSSLLEAEQHAESCQHKLEVYGHIEPDPKPKNKRRK